MSFVLGLSQLTAEIDSYYIEGLLLLLEITKTNQEIQKIVAFEGGFEQLFQIMKDEGLNRSHLFTFSFIHSFLFFYIIFFSLLNFILFFLFYERNGKWNNCSSRLSPHSYQSPSR
jgi:hypothetical protein